MWAYTFPLTSGRMVTIEGLHVSDTGEDNVRAEYESQYIDSARRYGNVLWSEPRSTFVIAPEHVRVAYGAIPPYKRLPLLVYHARLVCYEDFKDDVMSELIVIWFGEPEPHTGILDIVSRATKEIPWEELARPCHP